MGAAKEENQQRVDAPTPATHDHDHKSPYVAFRQGFGKAQSLAKTGLLVILYVGIGTAVYSTSEPKADDGDDKWSFTDAVYFCTVTMSTVGYGDLYPTTPATKTFTILWIVIGIVFVFSAVANVIGQLIHPLGTKGRALLERAFPQIPVDLNNDGSVDFYKPRAAWIYYPKNLLPLFVVVAFAQLSCAAVFVAIEGWDYGDAVWHCLVTATTVGYGDMRIATNGGKWWASFHIIISVSLLGDLIATSDELREERKATLAKVKQLTRPLDKKLLDDLMKCAKELRSDLVRDGLGLTELEFVLGMLIELEIVEWGKVRPFILKFREFDMDGSGRLGQNDLDMMLRGAERLPPTMNVSKRSLSHTSPPRGSTKISAVAPENDPASKVSELTPPGDGNDTPKMTPIAEP
mmetsp:Transcript_32772/g.89750  ORF Transcript_32772/g.89750 Transcript_32772/m.89750 type:complete len:405 (-) Transcript_32772:225-1439(-)